MHHAPSFVSSARTCLLALCAALLAVAVAAQPVPRNRRAHLEPGTPSRSPLRTAPGARAPTHTFSWSLGRLGTYGLSPGIAESPRISGRMRPGHLVQSRAGEPRTRPLLPSPRGPERGRARAGWNAHECANRVWSWRFDERGAVLDSN